MKRGLAALKKTKKLEIIICPDVIRFAHFYQKFHGINWPSECVSLLLRNFTG